MVENAAGLKNRDYYHGSRHFIRLTTRLVAFFSIVGFMTLWRLSVVEQSLMALAGAAAAISAGRTGRARPLFAVGALFLIAPLPWIFIRGHTEVARMFGTPIYADGATEYLRLVLRGTASLLWTYWVLFDYSPSEILGALRALHVPQPFLVILWLMWINIRKFRSAVSTISAAFVMRLRIASAGNKRKARGVPFSTAAAMFAKSIKHLLQTAVERSISTSSNLEFRGVTSVEDMVLLLPAMDAPVQWDFVVAIIGGLALLKIML